MGYIIQITFGSDLFIFDFVYISNEKEILYPVALKKKTKKKYS